MNGETEIERGMPPPATLQPIQRSKRGNDCIYRRADSPNLWITYSRGGRKYSECAKTDDPRKAERMLQLRRYAKDEDFLSPQIRHIKVDDLAEDLIRQYRVNGRKSIDALERRWKHLQKFVGGRRAFSVDATDIARYIDKRQQEGAANATINRELAALRTMFYLGRKHKKVGTVPDFELLEENNVRQGFAEESQIRKLFEYCSELWFRAFGSARSSNVRGAMAGEKTNCSICR